MGLAEFIRANRDAIISEWETFACSLSPAVGMSSLQLKDHVGQILLFIARDIEEPQTASEQKDKSHGLKNGMGGDTAAEAHGRLRHADGYDIVEMISEYRALRASIIRLWTREERMLTGADAIALTRFNEAIDQALTESVARFSRQVDHSKDLILGVLGHDIRSPLATIYMSAEILKRTAVLDERQSVLLKQIESSTVRVRSIVTDLLDLARAKLGAGIPLFAVPMSLTNMCRDIVSEIRVQHPSRTFVLELAPNVSGDWDEIRLGQVLSNLLANAVQYGTEGTPITISLIERVGDILLSVHNEGPPIPRAQLSRIFQSFTRGSERGNAEGDGQNLGLGLFISREIINAHGGTINVHSDAASGITFNLCIPASGAVEALITQAGD
ncbi:sensor histidine kinase KdpD [Asticcacaulis sp. AND118]|uniref:sensor histidine kinase n=1 Tax=Asticcacaulis sp. AND118 TaxID=2840468 RepID=UPI001CFFA0BB|nr:HAMP domain-containing sensor histidine kinase [Asticcacaulis sp. AND118]UDF05580.1 HAMP domain-containing histidine kinase [Asticcacaulis sp. AND118]